MSTSRPEVVVLRAGDTEASVVPAIGANCVAARVGELALIEEPPDLGALASRPTGYGCPILFPFPGQLEPGWLRLLGREVRVDANAPNGRHVHGFASARPWRLVDRTPESCTCRLEGGGDDFYPWRFRITARWRVTPGMLGVGVGVENLDDGDMPFGLGLHPYFPVEPDAVVEVPSSAVWTHAGGIPSGQPMRGRGPWRWRELPATGSTLLTDLPREDVTARAGAVALRWPGDQLGEVVLYRPPERTSVCVEPWTSVSNAATQIEPGARHGLVVLPPGATWRAWLEIMPFADGRQK